MHVNDILRELETMGSESTKRIFANHGASEPFFGVKVGDLKTIVKRVKKNHELSLALFDTGNADAMYLAGLIADEKRIRPEDLQRWVENASWYMISEYTVAWIAAESPHGWEMALRWIDSDQEKIASSGWATLASLVAIRPDDALDLPALSDLLERVVATLHTAPNRVRYAMNTFVMAAGSCVTGLTENALEAARKLGKVDVQMGGTACKVPPAAEYIRKVQDMGRLGVKKKMARC